MAAEYLYTTALTREQAADSANYLKRRGYHGVIRPVKDKRGEITGYQIFTERRVAEVGSESDYTEQRVTLSNAGFQEEHPETTHGSLGVYQWFEAPHKIRRED